jgi:hypothetical protein
VIQGKAVSAQTHIPLRAGQNVLLRVTRAGANPRFQLVQAQGGGTLHAASDILQTLGRSEFHAFLARLFTMITASKSKYVPGLPHEADVFERMGRLLESMVGMIDQPDRHAVKSYITQTGMTWENKLVSLIGAQKHLPPTLVKRLIAGDLKALSLQITRNAAGKKAPWLEDIRGYLENIENLQLLNSRISGDSGRYFVPLPVVFEEQIRFGQLLIDLGKDGEPDSENMDRIIQVSLLLEMSSLGHMQVELSILKNAITCMFGVEDDTARQRIEGQLGQLIEKFDRSGFHVHEMNCRTVSPRTLHTASLAERLVDDRDGVLRIVV